MVGRQTQFPTAAKQIPKQMEPRTELPDMQHITAWDQTRLPDIAGRRFGWRIALGWPMPSKQCAALMWLMLNE